MTALSHFVVHIIRMRTHSKMRYFYTSWVITNVHYHCIFINGPMVKHPCNAMRALRGFETPSL
jgi:hypothetical protein